VTDGEAALKPEEVTTTTRKLTTYFTTLCSSALPLDEVTVFKGRLLLLFRQHRKGVHGRKGREKGREGERERERERESG